MAIVKPNCPTKASDSQTEGGCFLFMFSGRDQCDLIPIGCLPPRQDCRHSFAASASHSSNRKSSILPLRLLALVMLPPCLRLRFLTSYLSYYTSGIIAHGIEDMQQVIQSGSAPFGVIAETPTRGRDKSGPYRWGLGILQNCPVRPVTHFSFAFLINNSLSIKHFGNCQNSL